MYLCMYYIHIYTYYVCIYLSKDAYATTIYLSDMNFIKTTTF